MLAEAGLDVDNIDVRRDPAPYCAAGTGLGSALLLCFDRGCCAGGLDHDAVRRVVSLGEAA
ncbi:MAG TPA: hypothetical protein VE645_16005 [Pseudonocardiaceae bacterium]|nr:hypothetical protein [Pseudonocardiaceae bacterium]